MNKTSSDVWGGNLGPEQSGCVMSWSFETKILRGINGPICEEAVWRSRYNEELYRLYDEADLVTTIKITRLRWAGHVM